MVSLSPCRIGDACTRTSATVSSKNSYYLRAPILLPSNKTLDDLHPTSPRNRHISPPGQSHKQNHNMAPLAALSSSTTSALRPMSAVRAGSAQYAERSSAMTTVAPMASKLGEHFRTGVVAVTLAIAMAPAAQAVDADYLQRIQAVEAEEVKEVLNGEGPPIAKDPILAAYLSFGATAAITIGGANLFLSNSPTNRMWQAKKDEEKRMAEEAAIHGDEAGEAGAR